MATLELHAGRLLPVRVIHVYGKTLNFLSISRTIPTKNIRDASLMPQW